MANHRIEVDAEVMAYLKSEAEAFVDTPNTVLRRLLLDNHGKVAGGVAGESDAVPDVGSGLPKALEQVLQVAYLVRFHSLDRIAATHAVAHHHGVAFQTVLDKYARQLDLTTDEFDSLLREEDLKGLRRLLAERFPKFHSRIAVLAAQETDQ